MKTNPAEFDLRTPDTFSKALALLAEPQGKWRPFAGGTDLMVLLESGNLEHKSFVNLRGFKELQGIEVSPQFVVLGALTTFSSIQENEVIIKEFPCLVQAASQIGALAIQNRGTIGGNIGNASPAADSPPVLLIYDAEIELMSVSGARWVSYDSFHTGYKKTQLRMSEVISKVRLSRASVSGGKTVHYFRKVGARKAQAISKVSVAGWAYVEKGLIKDVRLALGSVAPTVVRGKQTETLLRGKSLTPALRAEACKVLGLEISPISDIRSTDVYRRRIAQNLLSEFLEHVGLDQ
ncbi:xanthine dehydrogenase family protein subunit M [Bdellovibrionota bacterium FG-2]